MDGRLGLYLGNDSFDANSIRGFQPVQSSEHMLVRSNVRLGGIDRLLFFPLCLR